MPGQVSQTLVVDLFTEKASLFFRLEELLQQPESVEPQQSVPAPTQTLPHLGFVLNFKQMVVTLTPEKAEKIELTCSQVLVFETLTIQELAELGGQLVSSFSGVEHGHCFIGDLTITKH